MKLLILGLLAIVVLSTASSRDCFWRWRGEDRERTREFRQERRKEMHAWREQRDRIREQIRADIRDFRHDWR
jgi:hypothetical protein